jgi:hypothetical protein
VCAVSGQMGGQRALAASTFSIDDCNDGHEDLCPE